jgi:pyruvate dehydrogenase E1 component alpha subunit
MTAPSDEKDRLGLFTAMVRIRRFEERCVELYSAGRIRGFMHLCVGEEAVAVGVLDALNAEDAVVSTYREHGHALARGVPMEAVFAEMFGRTTGTSRGRGGSMHLFDTARRFYGGNAIVAGGIPVAAGLALAAAMQARRQVTVCLFGDGAAAEGEFHEALNLAALWRLPVVFCCENNQYAMGTALARSHAQTDLALRAASYGLRSWPVDGMDVLAVREAAGRAVDTARDGGGPCFLELRTYRFRAHSMYDADRYRDRDEIARWRERDPVELLHGALRADGTLDDAGREAVETEVASEIDLAVAAAESGPLEPVGELTRFVTSERS